MSCYYNFEQIFVGGAYEQKIHPGPSHDPPRTGPALMKKYQNQSPLYIHLTCIWMMVIHFWQVFFTMVWVLSLYLFYSSSSCDKKPTRITYESVGMWKNCWLLIAVFMFNQGAIYFYLKGGLCVLFWVLSLFHDY